MSGNETEFDVVAADLYKRFGENEVLKGMTLRVRKGETFVIVGRSGIGKSVFLKHIVGLMHPDRGEIRVFGKDIRDLSGDELLEHRRCIGMVFQHSALLNSLTVEENVALGLTENGMKDMDEVRRIVNEKLSQVRMDGTNDQLPETLSGGMKKRVAVARTLALGPRIILFDEPTTGLDPIMSDNVDDLILDLREQVGCTCVVVTHDMITAFRVADRIGLFHDGRLIEVAAPEDFRKSERPEVREFIGRESKWRD